MHKNQKVIIVGKGQSAVFLKKEDYKNTILVAINQAALFIDSPDFIFANDIEGLQGIEEQKFLNTKNLAIPEYPHFKLKPHPSITFKLIANKAKNNLIVYNIWSCGKPSKIYPYIDHKVVSTGDTAVAFFAELYSVKNFELYGIAKGCGYNEEVLKSINTELKRYSLNWNKNNVSRVKDSIEKLKNKYGLSIKIN